MNETRKDGIRLTAGLRRHFAWYYPDGDVLLVGAVELGPAVTGFLLRVPGMFVASVIDLWPWDARQRRWLAPVELVDNWGDSDQWYLARAWLVDVGGDGHRDVVKREKIGEAGRMAADRLTVRRFTTSGFVSSHPARELEPRFDFALACKN